MNVETSGNVLIARLAEKYDAFTEDGLDDAQRSMLSAVEGSRPPRLLLDMSQTRYFSSSFLEVLFRVWNQIKKEPGSAFVLAGAQPLCQEILRASRLDTLWPMYPTVEDALRELDKQPVET